MCIPQNDGTQKFVSVKAEPLFNEKGQVVRVIGTLQDITDNKILTQKLENSYRIINQAQALTKTGSWELDLITRKTLWSDEVYKLVGITPEQYDNTQEGFYKFVHPDDIRLIENTLNNTHKKSTTLEYRIFKQSDNSLRHVYALMEFVLDKNSKPIYVYGTIQDITDQKLLQQELEKKNEKIARIQKRYNALIKKSVNVYIIIESDGTIFYISENAEGIIGYKVEECINKKIFDFCDENQKQRLMEMIETTIGKPSQTVKRDVPFYNKAGEEIYLEIFMQDLTQNEAIGGIMVTLRDITKRVEMEKRMTHLSTHEHLTGLPNNIYFRDKLKKLFECARGTYKRFGVFMLDINNHKYIRDTLGYNIGEKLLVQISARLKEWCGESRFLSRYFGDRFVIIVEGVDDEAEYETLASEVIQLFSENINLGKYELDVDVALGVSLYNYDIKDPEDLIRNAETALFLAKNEGKNNYKFYYADNVTQDYRQFILRNDIEIALLNEQLSICYQPLVDIKTNKIVAAEALIRWNHPHWGIVSPNDFISIAEETGSIIRIGNWMFKEVCHNYKQWLNKGCSEIKISVNFSSVQFFETDFVENIMKTIDEFDLDPSFLIMEITESILMVNVKKAISDIKKLRSFGIKIALDDFGTGFSSLAYLNTLNIDLLKIDGSFIKNLQEDEANAVITRYIINMARELKIKVVAEGIENLEQLSFLQKLKCVVGQGYIYSEPLVQNDFEKLLAKGICNPRLAEKIKTGVFKDRRKFFRITFSQLLEAGLTIKEINGRIVNLKSTYVLIEDIGPSGLRFISHIKFPVTELIKIQFVTKLFDEEVRLYGHTAWVKKIENGKLYEYGINFTITEDERTELIRILNRILIMTKNNHVFTEGSFTTMSPGVYFIYKTDASKG